MHGQLRTVNFILYCRKWEQSVEFYRERLHLPVLFSTDWFFEFGLGSGLRLSVADESRCSVKTGNGDGVTLSLEVDDIEMVREAMAESGVKPSEIAAHPWNARIFYFFDPEGHRIEIWQPIEPEQK